MSIESSKALTRQREYFRKIFDDQQRANDANLKNLEETNESLRKEQAENYYKDKLKLEKEYGDKYDNIQNDQKKALFAKDRQYQETLNNQNSEFQNERRVAINKFDDEYSRLNEEYNRLTADQRAGYDKRTDDLAKLSDDQVNFVRESSEKELNTFKNNNKISVDERVRDLQSDIRNNQKEYQKELNKTVKEGIEKNQFLKKQGLQDIENIKDRVKRDRFMRNEVQAQRFSDLNQASDMKVEEADKLSKQRIESAFESNRETLKAQSREFGERFANQEKMNNENLREIQYKMTKQVSNPNSLQHQLEDAKRLNQRDQVRQQRQVFIDERQRVLDDSDKRLDESQEVFQRNYKIKRREYADNLEKLKWDQTKTMQEEKIANRDKRDRLSKVYDKNLNAQDVRFEDKLSTERKQNLSKVDNLRSDLNDQVKLITTKSQKEVAEVKRDAASDKKQMAERLLNDSAEKREYLQKVNAERIAKTHDKYQIELEEMRRNNRDLKDEMNSKVYELTRRQNIELETLRTSMKKEMKKELEDQAKMATARESALRAEIPRRVEQYEKKISDITKYNGKVVKELQMDHKIQMREQEKKYQKIIDQTNKFSQREIERLKLASEDEKTRIITQYENQIQKLKLAFEKKQTEIDEFNKLSAVG